MSSLYIVASQKPETKLLGSTKEETAEVIQFMSFSDNELVSPILTWLLPIMGYMPYNQAAHNKAVADLNRALAALDQILLTRTYLVSNHVTLADICVATTVSSAMSKLLDAEARRPYVNVNRWYITLLNQPEFKEVLGPVKLCETPLKYTPPKKEAAPKAAPKKQESKEVADEEEAAPEKPKEKNPLDLLPPSKFNLDAWKRFYSNNETRPDAVKWFWENYDPEGFSMWRVTFKYNHENTLVFMSSNLIGGFFQRLDRARKYAFGTMLVLGEDNKNEITGFFVFRGQDIPTEVREAADFESYDFKKVNSSDKVIRETFEDFIAWDGKLEGKKFADGKIFK